MRVISLLVAAALLAPLPAAAQTTPWGDPDFQGVWSNQTQVPLERPAALANKPFFTKQEAADAENVMWRSDDQIFESACHEGNIGLANILSGAGAQERAAR